MRSSQNTCLKAPLTSPGLSVQAVVTKVCGHGRRQFAVTYPRDPPEGSGLSEDGSITFSMSAWSGTALPRQGQVVQLDDIILFEQGWRASAAKPIPARSQQ